VVRRILLLGGIAALFGQVAEAAEPARSPPRRPRTVRRTAPSTRPRAGAAPSIDPAPTPSRTGGFEPAPTAARDRLPPARDRVVGPTVDFGVPTPRELQQGQTFRGGDPGLESRGDSSQGARMPAPGATVRLPF